MKIVVCIKQVPDTKDIKWTENGTMIRDGVESILNPYDETALEYALSIKDKFSDTKITVISMGPNQVKELLKICKAKGVDETFLISDKKFSGSDTLATSYTIAQAIKQVCKDFDLIICGQFAIDGDTGQTPVSISDNLNIENITFVKNILEIDKKSITLLKETEEGFFKLKADFPLLISVLKNEDIELRHFTIKNYIDAYNYNIKVLDKNSLATEENKIGFKGSPTFVAASYPPKISRESKESNTEEIFTRYLSVNLHNSTQK